MTESRLTSIQSPKLPEAQTASARIPGFDARIITLPEKLFHLKHSAEIRGEIIRLKSDGTISLRTDQGDIDIDPQTKQNLSQGQIVEIKIQAGQPPRLAQIRPIREDTQAARLSTTPVDIDLGSSENITSKPDLVIYEDKTHDDYLIAGRPLHLVPTLDYALQQNFYVDNQTLETDFIDSLQNISLISINFITTGIISVSQNLLQDNFNIFLSSDPLKSFPNFEISHFFHESLDEVVGSSPSTLLLSPTLSFYLPLSDKDQFEHKLTIGSFKSIIDSARQRMTFIPSPLNVRIIGSSFPPLIMQDRSFQNQDLPLRTENNLDFLLNKNLRAGMLEASVEATNHSENQHFLRIKIPGSGKDFLFITEDLDQSLPIGTLLEIITSMPSSQNIQNIGFAELITPYSLSTSTIWNTFQDLHQTLLTQSPLIAQNFATLIPNPANLNNFGSAAILFFFVVRNGDIGSWLGEKTIDILRRAGKSDLITRLSQEISGLSRISLEPISQEWKAHSFPMMWDNTIYKLSVFSKRDQTREQDSSQQNGIRFLINLNLSNMGKMQLDALLRKNQLRLDLILRSEYAFSSAMQSEMREVYSDGLKETSLTGELSFQSDPFAWVHITPQTRNEFSQNI